MDIDGMILNGYLRLYCKIMGIEPPPPRCRFCGGEVDKNFKKRKAGYLCYQCFKERNRRSHGVNHRGSASVIAQRTYPLPDKCEVKGCSNPGIRHHNDYSKPREIRWLCPKHHYQYHHLHLSV